MKMLTAEDVLKLVEERAQSMRENGPADMRDMLYFIQSIRKKVKAKKNEMKDTELMEKNV